jgi:hypothetical protein
MTTATAGDEYPMEIKISEKVSAFVGYNNDSIRIAIKVPIVGKVSVWIDKEDMPSVTKVDEAYKKWLAIPGPVRLMKGAKP